MNANGVKLYVLSTQYNIFKEDFVSFYEWIFYFLSTIKSAILASVWNSIIYKKSVPDVPK